MKRSDVLIDCSMLFLIFLTSFISIKAIFIIFFNTPFDPQFLLHLSPLHLLESVTELQLLVTSLFLVITDLYLHLIGKKGRLYSIPITLTILTGLSLSIMSSEVNIGMGVEYIIFLAFLMVLTSDIKIYLMPHGAIQTSINLRSKISNLHSDSSYTLESDRYKIPTDLVLINDIDKEHIEILRSLGIKNVDDLANVDASKLVKDFKRYMKELEDAISDLTKDKVEIWIENAKNLVNERNRFRNA